MLTALGKSTVQTIRDSVNEGNRTKIKEASENYLKICPH
jgi:hypothetical protein